MADLVVCIEWRGRGARNRTMKLGGVVIACDEKGNGSFEITVLFLSGCETCAAAFRHSPN